MTPEFLLSVVIPNRNRAHSLVRAVLSVREDSSDIEIVVVDDCSDADLSAEYGRLQDIGVRVFRQDSHRRGGAARNRGVREASGTHVSFLDSDDVWLPGRHDRVRRFYALPENARTVLVSGALLHVGGEIRHPHQPEWRPGSSLVDYAYRDMGRVQTSMLNLPIGIARSCLWNEDLRVNQDTDLAMRLDRAGIGFHIDPEPGVIKEETIRAGRLTTGAETADLSYAWYRRESGDWSPAARSGYHLQDRVWRLADSGRRGSAAVALARSLFPPVTPRETARRAVSLLLGPRLYAGLRRSFRGIMTRKPPAAGAGGQDAGERWRELDARAQAFCAGAPAASEPGQGLQAGQRKTG
ncbi:MAG TPA: glycosyltransferase family 2 protein [Paracoccus sp. (in: a-proteobacteria)]|nr:glycosyltransferase family 2 protein [Paracoccus sp. (in: a-proteobacteria)]